MERFHIVLVVSSATYLGVALGTPQPFIPSHRKAHLCVHATLCSNSLVVKAKDVTL